MQDKAEFILVGALRQYRGNTSDAFVPAYELYETEQAVIGLLNESKELKLQLDLMTSSRDHCKRLLDSCETALQGRDDNNGRLEAKLSACRELVKEAREKPKEEFPDSYDNGYRAATGHFASRLNNILEGK